LLECKDKDVCQSGFFLFTRLDNKDVGFLRRGDINGFTFPDNRVANHLPAGPGIDSGITFFLGRKTPNHLRPDP